MTILSGPRREAQSGNGTSLVILLHGYGADGNDLIGLADPLAPHLPDTIFAAPNAPARCTNNPMGYQWFSIPWMDGSSEAQAATEMAAAVDDLNETLDALAAETGIGPEKTVLVGFSQGTMMSLHVGPRRDAQYAGIVGFSGPQAADALVGAGFEVYTHVSEGIGHGIAPDGLGLTLQFIQDRI